MLADYYARTAVAASQVLAGFDEERFRDTLSNTRLGIAFGPDAATSREGRVMLDLLVRLAARLYPTLILTTANDGQELLCDLAALARDINPLIDIDGGEPTVTIAVGAITPGAGGTVIYAGSNGWDARVSTEHSCSLGVSGNPLGAGAAACLAMANVFRAVFLDETAVLDKDTTLSVLDRTPVASTEQPSIEQVDVGEVLLVGAGAIGNATIWAIAHTDVTGLIHIIDHEQVELSNLQRYVLASRADESATKVDVGARYLAGSLLATPHPQTWAAFVDAAGYEWARALVALDSAADRRAVQASLPRWVSNAWTQPGDLGLSIHPAFDAGACLACLYLPSEQVANEDAVIAQALGVPERLMEIRDLLYRGAGAPRGLLEAVAAALNVPLDRAMAFEGRPVRTLYVDGVCGGAVISLGNAGAASQPVHVPLAHQSALAGILLAGSLLGAAASHNPVATTVTRLDVMHPLTEHLTQPAQKIGDGRCLCEDADYAAVYQEKYVHPPALGSGGANSRRSQTPTH